MMKRPVSRRTFLRGAGAALALPWLDTLAARAGTRLAAAGRRALWREDIRAAITLIERALTMSNYGVPVHEISFDLNDVVMDAATSNDRILAAIWVSFLPRNAWIARVASSPLLDPCGIEYDERVGDHVVLGVLGNEERR